eukprot:Rhum_TRINITY_DN20644_c0_g1::Rhum_TRINITY_DN20644_c0_g1_i1::g.171786::m.171786
MVAGCPYIDAHDPGNRSQYVLIPLNETFPTQGRDAYLHGYSTRTVSVCMLFYRGKCKSQRNCRQLHTSPATLDRLRDEAAGECCAVHSCSKIPQGEVVIRLRGGGTATKPLGLFAPTHGLLHLLRHGGSRIVVNESRVCGLNGMKRCRWGEACHNIHMCRDETLHVKPSDASEDNDENDEDDEQSLSSIPSLDDASSAAGSAPAAESGSPEAALPEEPVGVLDDALTRFAASWRE